MKTNLNDQVKSEYHSYLRTKAMVDYYKPLAQQFARDNSDLKNWTVTFGSDQRVLIMFYSHQDEEPKLSDFVRLRGAIIDTFSRPGEPEIKLTTKLDGFLGKGSEFIGAKGDLPPIRWKHGTLRPSIEIRMFGVDKCEIEYVEEVVQRPVLSGFCAEVVNQ